MLVDIASVIVRGLSFIAIFQATGMAIFNRVFHRTISSGTRRSLRATTIASVVAALILTLLHFALEPARMGGELAAISDPTLRAIAMESPQAHAVAWKMAGLILVLAGMMSASRIGGAFVLAGAAGVFFGFTTVGHTAASETHWLLQPLLWMHVAVAGFWFGALLPLYQVAGKEPAAIASAVVVRFSRLAIALVPALALAGLAMAGVLLGSLESLRTIYGEILAFKVAAFAVLMGLAALNRLRYGPGLAAGTPAVMRAFRRTVAVEYGLLVSILLATAVLTALFSPDH